MPRYTKEIEDAKHISYLKSGKLVAVFERKEKKNDYIFGECIWRSDEKHSVVRYSIGQLYTIYCDDVAKHLMRNEEYYKKNFECRPSTDVEVNMAIVITKLGNGK